MDLQDRYDELDNLINTVDNLIGELSDKYYIENLSSIKYEAQNEKDEISEHLQEQQTKEEKQQEREYWQEAI